MVHFTFSLIVRVYGAAWPIMIVANARVLALVILGAVVSSVAVTGVVGEGGKDDDDDVEADDVEADGDHKWRLGGTEFVRVGFELTQKMERM
jgi:hypothetical protein